MTLLTPHRRALLHEWSLYLASHPALWLLAEATRRMGPVVPVPGLGTIINDPLIARAIMTNDAAFTKTGPGSMSRVITQVMGPHALLNMDGPEHRALRGKLTDLFTPASARALTDAVFAAPLAALTERLRRGEAVDLVPVVRELTGRMTCHLLGVVPPPGQETATYLRVVALSEQLASYASIRMCPLSEAHIREVREPFDALMAVAQTAYAQSAEDRSAVGSRQSAGMPVGAGAGLSSDTGISRCPIHGGWNAERGMSSLPTADHRPPTDSIIARLKAMGLSFEEARGVLAALFLVGTQTVSVAMPRIVALLVDTGEWGRLLTQPASLPAVIAEGLRCTLPTPVNYRTVAVDTEIAGHRFRAGSRALLFTYNTAKDARFFPDPLRFDPARTPDARLRHLPYGVGPHFCLGHALAQAEMHAILAALLTVGDLRVTHRAAARRVMLPGYRRLIVQRTGAGKESAR